MIDSGQGTLRRRQSLLAFDDVEQFAHVDDRQEDGLPTRLRSRQERLNYRLARLALEVCQERKAIQHVGGALSGHAASLCAALGAAPPGALASAAGGLALPHLERMGLGCCAPVAGISPHVTATCAWGTAEPASAGKDSTTGHWEICGRVIERPFPTYPAGFPAEIIVEFARRTNSAMMRYPAESFGRTSEPP